jgi:ADP-heptose:LPS heptosyltransferase
VPEAKYVTPEEVLGGAGLVDEFLYFHSGGFRWTGLKSILLLAWETFCRRPALVIVLEAPGRYTRKVSFFRWLGCRVVPDERNFFATASLQMQLSNDLVEPIWKQLMLVVAQLPEGSRSQGIPSAYLPLRAEAAPAVEEWIARIGAKGRRIIGLGIWSNMPSKRWPLDRYRELIVRLQASDKRIFPVILGSREERLLGLDLLRDLETGAVAAGELSITESAHLLSRSILYVGNDTGIMHLAAAVGTPCVGIFSARDEPGKWHPYGANNVVLRKRPSCAGCMLRDCREFHLRCLTEISVDEAFAACDALLSLSPKA